MNNSAYACWLFPEFEQRLQYMRTRVRFLKNHNPDYKQHPHTKLLLSTWSVMKESLSQPNAPQYKLGNTLGQENRHWRRCKDRLPPRYRLFFQFSSDESACIYVWLNNENTLRKAGSRKDVYAVFANLLQSKIIPQKFYDLLEQSREAIDKDWTVD